MTKIITPPDVVVFLGLGQMGFPMAKRCLAAGFEVQGADPSASARRSFAVAGGKVFETGREGRKRRLLLITMLPDSKVVREAVLGPKVSRTCWPKMR